MTDKTRKETAAAIQAGETCLGIELGSTRIKAVLTDMDHRPVASGDHVWENKYENGNWTYSLDDVWNGLQTCYARLAADVMENYGTALTKIGAVGISAMMHGYLPFDSDGRLLTPFRTWRNTATGEAAGELTELLGFNIPQRWSIAHLYQAILNGEEHVGSIAFMTTLAGYVHWKLTGEKVLGIGDASGMFPTDILTGDYDSAMLDKVQKLLGSKGWSISLSGILPKVLTAGDDAGRLTEEGARLLDPTGLLHAGSPAAPPEGDAGTGMTATNAVAERTGNVSAGTSIFSMVVLEKPLAGCHEEIDIVATPAGKPVAMVHCNNCTNEINAWAGVFRGLLEAMGQSADMNRLYETMFLSASEGEKDCGGLVSINYLSGEPVTGFAEGRPLLVRGPEADLSFANLMRSQLYSAAATLSIGMDILRSEGVHIDRLVGHGGFFKTPDAGQSVMAAAMEVPVSVMETAGEGGAWGMAVLAAYMTKRSEDETLEDYLENRVFRSQKVHTLAPVPEDIEGFRKYIERFRAALNAERAAIEAI